MSRPDWTREGARWPHRDASRFVEAGGLRWHVQVMGEGPVALLIHGTGAASHSWRGLMPLLAERYQVVAIDLPGHGFTCEPGTGGYALPEMAVAIGQLLAQLAVKPALVIGHSAGAAIAAQLALTGVTDCPIVAINGALLPFPGAAKVIFPTMAKALFLNPIVPRLFSLQGQSRRLVKNFLERSTGSRIDDEGARTYQSLFAHSGHCGAALGMMAWWNLDRLDAQLDKLAVPMLLLAGDRDAAVPPSVSDRVAKRLAGAEVLRLPGIGHLAHEEAPEVVASAILEWCNARVKQSEERG
jgi:magnesium chelatase accessory protein